VNLVEEGFDVGVRIGELPDSTYRALNVGEVNWLVVAAPEYLHEHGVPQSPQALREHTIIASSAGEFQVNWRFKKEPDNQVRLKPRLQTSTNDAAIEAAVGGLGITRVLSYQVAEDLASGRLQTLLEDYQSAPLPVNIVHRLGRYETVRIRTFIDLLVDALRENGGF
jgi:DNA-binding transcriptional LysR family regulator